MGEAENSERWPETSSLTATLWWFLDKGDDGVNSASYKLTNKDRERVQRGRRRPATPCLRAMVSEMSFGSVAICRKEEEQKGFPLECEE
jgi:hypothetical protein